MFDPCDQLKNRLDGLRPIETKHIEKIRSYWHVGLAFTSNALEGSTLTESETKVILEDGLTVSGKPLREHMEAIGHKDSLNYLFKVYREGFSETTIKELHRLFYFRIDESQAGVYREENVIITGTDYIPPEFNQVPALMAGFDLNVSEAGHPIALAAKAHEKLVNIHPFIDGNGRTARLLMNLILLQSGFPIALIPPIYRPKYIAAAKAGNKGESQQFLTLLTQVMEQSLRDYLRMLERLG